MHKIRYELQKAVFIDLFKVLIDEKTSLYQPRMQKIDTSFQIDLTELLD